MDLLVQHMVDNRDARGKDAPRSRRDCLSRTMIDGRLPSKNPLSPENIVRVVASGLSIHTGKPTIGRDEIILDRNSWGNSSVGNDKSGCVILLWPRFLLSYGFCAADQVLATPLSSTTITSESVLRWSGRSDPDPVREHRVPTTDRDATRRSHGRRAPPSTRRASPPP